MLSNLEEAMTEGLFPSVSLLLLELIVQPTAKAIQEGGDALLSLMKKVKEMRGGQQGLRVHIVPVDAYYAAPVHSLYAHVRSAHAGMVSWCMHSGLKFPDV